MHLLRKAWDATRRPMASQWLALLAALAFALFYNTAFWQAFAATPSAQGAGSWRLAAGLFFGMWGLHTALLLLLVNRWTQRWLLPLLFLVSAAVVFYTSQYKVFIDADMVRNVLATERKEASELLTVNLGLTIALLGVLPALLLWRLQPVKRSVLRGAAVHGVGVLLALLVAAAAIGMSYQPMASFMRNEKPLRHLITPGNWLVATAQVLLDDGASNGSKAEIASDAVLMRPAHARPRLLLLVVGETVRAQNWGLNGYSRQTTPQLAQLGGVNYPDVTACGTNTEVSLPCMFSQQGLRGYDRKAIRTSQSLLHVLDRLGIATLWRDNQTGCKGVCDGLAVESFLDSQIADVCNAERCLDEVLLHELKQRMNANPGDQVIVLHMLGNHGPAYFKRYPDAFKHFTPACETEQLGDCSRQAIINAYDNSILYTDDVLARAVKLLRDALPERDTALLYLSDHGESLGEGGLFLHGVPPAIAPETQLKVPMWLWLSPQWQQADGIDMGCLQASSQHPRTHDVLFSSVLGMFRVHTSAYDPQQDVLAGCRGVANAVQ